VRGPATFSTQRKPVVGIVVGGVLSVITLTWSSYLLITSLSQNPSDLQRELWSRFPLLQLLSFSSQSVSVLGAGILLIGIILAQLMHPNGAKTVRVASWALLGYSLLSALGLLAIYTGSDNWVDLPAPVRGGLIGGAIGTGLGSAAQYAVILFLFRLPAIPSRQGSPS